MLPHKERIGTRDFRRDFEAGRLWRGGLLQMRIFRREVLHENASGENASAKNASGENVTRAAFVVTKKSGKAVVRNRLRRRVREIYRLSSRRSDARLARTDLLIFASANAIGATDEALRKSLEELLERAAKTLAAPNDLTKLDAPRRKIVAPKRAR